MLSDAARSIMTSPVPIMLFTLAFFLLPTAVNQTLLLLAFAIVSLYLGLLIDSPAAPIKKLPPRTRSTPKLNGLSADVDSSDDEAGGDSFGFSHVKLSGSLLKRGGLRLTTWQLRHFTLTPTELDWSAGQDSTVVIGKIKLSETVVAYEIDREVGGEMCVFVIEDKSRSDGKAVREFACTSRNERRRWVESINSSVEELRLEEIIPDGSFDLRPTPPVALFEPSGWTKDADYATSSTAQASSVPQHEGGEQATGPQLSPAASRLLDTVPGSRKSLEILRRAFPDVHPDALCRFAATKPSPTNSQSVIEKFYGDHRTWMRDYESKAVTYPAAMPTSVFAKGGKAVDGTSAFFVQGALFDPAAADNETYGHLAASQMAKIYADDTDLSLTTFFLDIRTDPSFANPAGFSLLPLFKTLLSMINDHNPMRMKSLVMYPVTPMLSWTISNILRLVCDAETRKKIILVKATDISGDPAPAGLWEYISLDQLPVETRQFHEIGSYKVVINE
jgi:hypothetical protein